MQSLRADSTESVPQSDIEIWASVVACDCALCLQPPLAKAVPESASATAAAMQTVLLIRVSWNVRPPGAARSVPCFLTCPLSRAGRSAFLAVQERLHHASRLVAAPRFDARADAGLDRLVQREAFPVA